ncbi:MAG: zeta toxin family protein [Arcobacteraceae bacterium]|jgi:predicted kinase|nr:zeta toxin family protein [Arcobacteraceae bacterium]
MNKIEKEALNYLKDNKKEFLEKYLNGYEVQEIKTAIFTAGASGAGKTEYAISRKEKEPFLLHMDIDDIRDFFSSIGYNGSNSSDYQRPASKGVNWLFDRAAKKGYSFILDSNFAEATIAQSNIQRLLDKGYVIEINYIFRNIQKSFEFAKKRESMTKRKVPLEVVKSSFKNSFDTTLLIKSIFQDAIILNIFDRENDIIHEDVDEKQFYILLAGEIL